MSVMVCVMLVIVAVGMAVISGVNDGGVLLALAVRYPVVSLGWFVGIVCMCLVAGPLLLGRSVARTLVSGLFGNRGSTEVAFLIGVVVALAVVVVLSRWGLPTSMTLALVGGLSGAAEGAHVGVSWDVVGRVLVIGAAAPVVGVLAGWLVGRLAGIRAAERRRPRAFRIAHLSAFTAQCLAYAVNDGQKMLAVAAVAVGALPGSRALLEPETAWWLLLSVLVGLMMLFWIGMVVSLRSVAPKIASGLAVLRPIDGVSAEFVGAAAVFGSSLAGAPVSMTQTVAGAVVGAAGSKGMRRVRWDSASRIAAAWLVTLPVSGISAYAVAMLVAR